MTSARKQEIGESIDKDSILIYAAIIGKEIVGTDTIHNEIQQMLPAPSGKVFKDSTHLGGGAYRFTISSGQQVGDVDAVVFLQHKGTKEVYMVRAGASQLVVHTEEAKPIEQQNVTVYPNPAHTQVTVAFEHPIAKAANWTLTDMAGKTADRGTWVQGTLRATLDVADYPSGVYLLFWTDEAGNKTAKQLIIRH